ncbi:MAG: FkbM family methyltransferase [Candidatus Sumerlaeia bacterium]|nr:FkbM family methyltransferase [Candidatus Sumerlaeia bacterium]
MSLAKRLAARLPARWQSELKRLQYARQIRRGSFATNEPEYALLPQIVAPGDWVIDIGANVGHYTKRLSELVGPTGRVIAFEPVPETFALLAANAACFPHANVTLLNAAVSERFDALGMTIPSFDSGLKNYYQAELTRSADAGLAVLTLSVDALGIDRRVSLVKIDAEGHEAPVLAGMRALIAAHHPTLIVETESAQTVANLEAAGYTSERLPGSPNVLFRARPRGCEQA